MRSRCSISRLSDCLFRQCEVAVSDRLCACVPFFYNTDIRIEFFKFTGCTTDITTSDHSPVFASFEVGVASQFVSKQGVIAERTVLLVVLRCNAVSRLLSDPNSEPEGGIQIVNCVATLMTKSKTKFFIEFHSSCLESRSPPRRCTLI